MDAVLDSAATRCCIARRCVSSNSVLRKLVAQPYDGLPLLDANKKPLAATHIIKVNFAAGTPLLSFSIDFVIVKDLPFSCIIGTELLSKLESWGVDNVKSTLSMNSSVIPVYDKPLHDNSVNLISTQKFTLMPGESKLVKTTAVGPGIAAIRPFTEQLCLTEGNEDIENRNSVRIFPSLNVIGRNNDKDVYVRVINTSGQKRSVGKGAKIASANNDVEEVYDTDPVETEPTQQEYVNSVNSKNVIDILCNRDELKHLSDNEFRKAKWLLKDFEDILVVSSEKVGRSNNSFFHIDSFSMNPVSVPLRRVPLHKQQIVQDLLDRYEELGLIERIDSPFRAATVLVEKKNVGKGKSVTDNYRLCVDYRMLNRQIEDSAWPAPSIEHCLDAAAGAMYLSSLDFNDGYFQIPCTESAKRALAFSPGFGFAQYTFNGMPQGAKSAASKYQQSMEKTFRGLETCILPPYFDDVNVKGKTFDDHLENVRRVLTRVRECGYTLNALKCKFFRREIKYLGHIIKDGTVFLDPDRVEAVVNTPPPTDVKGVRRLIGMAQFCSKFVPKFNDKLTPLYNLTRKNSTFSWNDDCQKAFQYIKDKLVSAPVLRAPSSTDSFILETDASDTGIGSCLKVVPSGQEYLTGYHSEKLDDPETRWHIVEKEAYAILKSVEKFRHYLIGKRFLLRTDNRILTYMQTSKSKKLANWALKLAEFEFDIVHVPSTNNQISDFFSRLHESVNTVTFLEPSMSNSEILKEQKIDIEMKHAFEYLKEKRNFDVSSLGSLKRYRKFLTIGDGGILLWKNKIVLPGRFRKEILSISHDHPTAGHFGVARSWKNVTQKYFWPGAQDDVVNWVRSCRSCNEFDVKTYVHRPLQPIDTSARFELVCYDIAGPFMPAVKTGNTYALIIVDHFSKWPEIVPLKDIKATTLATSIFEQWCCRYGMATQFHSDGAPNVHGEVVKELCKMIGSVKSKSSRLHPQGDGMAELTIRTLKSSIKKQVDKYGKNWDSFLQPTAFAMRTSVNTSTKHTPSEIVMGDNLMRPIDLSAETDTYTFSGKQASEFAAELTKKIDEVSKIVSENLSKARSDMKKAYDKKKSRHKFAVGDSVMLWWPYFKPGISRAFQPKWKGPYVIRRLVGDTNCTIELHDKSLKHVHLNQLKMAAVRVPHLLPESTAENEVEPLVIHDTP